MLKNSTPLHVAIIMDGNGRWAKKRLLPRTLGHSAGMKTMISLAERAKERGVKYFTVYALSSENLARPKEELDGIFNLIRDYFSNNLKRLYENNSAVKIIGDISALPDDCIEVLKDSEKNSPKDADFTIIFAINYGSRPEIVRAVNAAVERGESVDINSFSSLLYTDGIPDPDLVIRTGGEVRLSNFILWQAAYAELYFTDVLFPDFTPTELDKALEEYSLRDRRFGKIKNNSTKLKGNK